MVAASGQLGSAARHQTPQSDIPSSQGLHRLEPLEEWLTGRRSLQTPRGSTCRAESWWLRYQRTAVTMTSGGQR
jgi:hypothetical protein